MFYLWVYFGDRGKDFYLPDAKNWTGELPLNQADTRWDSDVVIPVRALDGQWFITPAQGFKWRNGRDAGEREMFQRKEKVAAEALLMFLSYDIRRAIMLAGGVQKLIHRMRETLAWMISQGMTLSI